MAGINAALEIRVNPPLILDRTEAYTAILIDDLISKGTNDSLIGMFHPAAPSSACTCESTTPTAA